MKKLLVSALALLLTLTGCSFSDAEAEPSNASDVVFTIGSTSVTNADLYYMLMYKEYGSTSTIISDMENAIFEKIAPVDDEITAAANEIVQSYKDQYGDYFNMVVSYSGYADEAEFLEKSAIPNAQYVKMVSLYANEKFSTLSVVYKPRKVQVICFADAENAAKALADAQSGTALADLIDTYEGDLSQTGVEQIISTGSSLDADVLNVVLATYANGVIASALQGSDGKYYVVNVVDSDPENFKEEAIDHLAKTVDLEKDAVRYFLQQYNFEISDKTTYDLIKADYPDYILD